MNAAAATMLKLIMAAGGMLKAEIEVFMAAPCSMKREVN